MKTYSFTVDREQMIPSTPTVVAFVQSAFDLNKNDITTFTGLDVMKNALDKGYWSTKQVTDKQLMTTWAYYLKVLKNIGFEETGSISHNGTRHMSMAEILGLDDEE